MSLWIFLCPQLKLEILKTAQSSVLAIIQKARGLVCEKGQHWSLCLSTCFLLPTPHPGWLSLDLALCTTSTSTLFWGCNHRGKGLWVEQQSSWGSFWCLLNSPSTSTRMRAQGKHCLKLPGGAFFTGSCSFPWHGIRLTWSELGNTLNWLPRRLRGKESTFQCRRCHKCQFNPWVGKIRSRRKWHSTPVLLPGKFHGQKSLASYNPKGRRVGHNWSNWAWQAE